MFFSIGSSLSYFFATVNSSVFDAILFLLLNITYISISSCSSVKSNAAFIFISFIYCFTFFVIHIMLIDIMVQVLYSLDRMLDHRVFHLSQTARYSV